VKTLQLAVTAEYFDQMKAGTKRFEYRLRTPYWAKRLAKAPFDRLIITKGYPSRDDASRRLVLPWLGYHWDTITHKHFGAAPSEVYAIHVSELAATAGNERKHP
jgi:hypothetical protein